MIELNIIDIKLLHQSQLIGCIYSKWLHSLIFAYIYVLFLFGKLIDEIKKMMALWINPYPSNILYNFLSLIIP